MTGVIIDRTLRSIITPYYFPSCNAQELGDAGDSSRCAAQPRPSGGGGVTALGVPQASKTGTPNYITPEIFKPVWQGIDSLYLSYEGQLFEAMLVRLERLKAMAQSEDETQRALAQITLGGRLYAVLDRGKGKFAYVVKNDLFHIQIGRKSKMPLAIIQISSAYLFQVGILHAVDEVHESIIPLGKLITAVPRVSRADVTVDFVTSIDHETVERKDWITRARFVRKNWEQNLYTGWSIGKGGDLSANLYHKMQEIFSVSHKTYLFDVWRGSLAS